GLKKQRRWTTSCAGTTTSERGANAIVAQVAIRSGPVPALDVEAGGGDARETRLVIVAGGVLIPLASSNGVSADRADMLHEGPPSAAGDEPILIVCARLEEHRVAGCVQSQ